MNSTAMLRVGAALLCIAALGGLGMAIIRFAQNKNPPSWVAMLHGFLAAAGLTLLVYATLTAVLPALATVGLVLLLAAALVGVVLNQKYQWRAALLPAGLVMTHVLFAVSGFLLVLVTAWRGV